MLLHQGKNSQLESLEYLAFMAERFNKPIPVDMPLAAWLISNRQRRLISIRKLSEATGVSHSRLIQIEQGEATTRTTLRLIVKAFAERDVADEESAQVMLNEAFIAAGFQAESEQESESPAVAFLKELPPRYHAKAERMLRAAFEEEDEIDAEGTIGHVRKRKEAND